MSPPCAMNPGMIRWKAQPLKERSRPAGSETTVSWCLMVSLFYSVFSEALGSKKSELFLKAAKENPTAHGSSQTEEWRVEGIWKGRRKMAQGLHGKSGLAGLHECVVVGLQSSQLIQTMAEQLMNPKPPPAADVAFLSSAKASKVLSLKRQKHSMGYLCTKKGRDCLKIQHSKLKSGHPFFGWAPLRK